MPVGNDREPARPGGHQAAAVTAQDLFRHVMRDLVAPGLREMGFRGGYTRTFGIAHGDYSSWLWTQKNRHSTRTQVDFWIHLCAGHEPSRSYWRKELHWLVPGMTSAGWTVQVDSPPEAVAESVLDSVRRYGLPAMQAAIDSPGFPPDPRAHWARTFPPAGDDLIDGPPDLGEIEWVLRPRGQEADQWLVMLASHSAIERLDALQRIAEKMEDDPRCRAALFDRHRRDPSRRVRTYAADLLGFPFNEDRYGPPALDEITWVLEPAGTPADEWFAKLATEDEAGRTDGLRMISREAADDPRTLPVLLDRLEHDPSRLVRQYAADLLTPHARTEAVRRALRDAAAQDEGMEVRWAARYALRLAALDSAEDRE
jgi:hypothetical protein